jgi:hypothetical protein
LGVAVWDFDFDVPPDPERLAPGAVVVFASGCVVVREGVVDVVLSPGVGDVSAESDPQPMASVPVTTIASRATVTRLRCACRLIDPGAEICGA